MTPTEYKTLIIKETKLDSFRLSDDDLNSFCDIARVFGSGELVINRFKKYLDDGNDDVMGFIEWCYELGGI